MADLHKVKQETFDLSHAINIDPKGFERAVDAYELSPNQPAAVQSGTANPNPVLYMRRPTPGHPRFHYLESWLVPTWTFALTNSTSSTGSSPRRTSI